MEPGAKRRRTDSECPNVNAESSNGASQYPYHNHHESITFDGNGISIRDGNLHVHGGLSVGQSTRATVTHSARQQLLDSLRFDQIDARQLSIKKAHAKTCRWFPKTTSYKQWENEDTSNDNQFLWIKGKPGAGKSTLMKFLLGHIQSRIRRSKASDVLISFFFNARGSDLEKSTVGLYRSLLLQLLEARQDLPSVLDAIKPDRSWDLDLLKSLFEGAVQSLEETSVVCLIDALDECEEAQIRDMVDFLSGLVNDGNRLYVCFASRHYPHITIQTGLDIILESQDEHESDIANYLGTALRIGHDELAEQIRLDLQEKASGVFMWVVLVVDILNKEYDAGRAYILRERLRQLPSSLYELFRDILTRDSRDKDGLLLCVQWILFAKQPLTPKQLYLAIVSGIDAAHLADCHTEESTDDNIQRYILNSSKGLAESTKSKIPTVQFIHESVKDFLLKEDGLHEVFKLETNIISESHEALRECCLTYMNMESLADVTGSSKLVDTRFPFLEYANKGILYHADQAEDNGISQYQFLLGFPRDKWVKHHNLLQTHKVRQYTAKASLLYILAEAGVPALIRVLAEDRSCFNPEDERYGLPILAATAMKNHTTTKAMLKLEAQRLSDFSYIEFCSRFSPCPDTLNAPSRNFTFNKEKKTFPQLVEYGSEMVALFFLNTDISEPSLKNERGQTVLMLAAKNGYTILIEELLRRGATISDTDQYGMTSLHYASMMAKTTAVKLLIDRGADISAVTNNGEIPLHWASRYGHIEVAKLLIERGADVSAVTNDRETPLHRALIYGHIEMVKLLVERGADVSAVMNDGRTPLHRASVDGHIEMVKLLVERGADVSAVMNDGVTPLHWASRYGHIEVAKLLIERGADVSAVTNDGETPLHWASRYGHIEVAKLLIERGADVSAVMNDGRTPLHRASVDGHIEMVKLLVERGADVSAVMNDGVTPLHWASRYGHIEVAKLLIERGADVSAVTNNGETPLHQASIYRHIKVAKLLQNAIALAPETHEPVYHI